MKYHNSRFLSYEDSFADSNYTNKFHGMLDETIGEVNTRLTSWSVKQQLNDVITRSTRFLMVTSFREYQL